MDNHLMLFVIAHEVENAEERRNIRINNRNLRDASNPFELPQANFMSLFRLNRESAWNLCQVLSIHMQSERISAIPSTIKILTSLYFFAHGSYQKCVGSCSLFGLSQPSVSRAIKTVSSAMCDHMLLQWIKFPISEDEKQTKKIEFYQRFNFRGVIGCIDCTHVAIVAPPADDPNFPGIVYINRKGYHSLNVQIVCDANLKIIAMNTKYPGSVHDAAIWSVSSIQQHLRQKYEQGQRATWLLGDSGYPLQPWLLTPIVGPPPETPEARYTRRHTGTRNVVERCIGLLKARFRCLLRHRTLHYDPTSCGKIIYACAILHNIAINNNDPGPEILENEELFIDDIPREQNWLQEGLETRQQVINTFI